MRIVFILGAVLLVVSCSGYQLTFNEKVIYSPPTIYSAYTVQDSALHSCLAQTLADKKISKQEQLQTLNCAYAGITDLTGLSHFKSLKTINLSNNKIVDIKPLLLLGQLENLNLTANPSIPCDDLKALQELVSGIFNPPKQCLQ